MNKEGGESVEETRNRGINNNQERIVYCPECQRKLIPAQTTVKEAVGVCPIGHGVFLLNGEKVIYNKAAE